MKAPRDQHTICGIATGTPDGGVAVVRISGPAAADIGGWLTGGLPAPRMAAVRRLTAAAEGAEGEQALVLWMPGPGSFTGEDVVELHVHGGARNVDSVVGAVLELGAVAAEAGEFTRRAFAHGRMDLAQAEGIAAVVGAQTEAALQQARRLAAGELGREVEALRTEVEGLRTEVEANLDFPEDVEAGDVRRWTETSTQLQGTMERWLARFEAGRRAREPARVVLAGPPNAGKSALLNRLAERRRAIVSETPGTTRDYVEVELQLGPYVAVVVDTAGLRGAGSNDIEVEGMALTRDQVGGADVVLWVEGADQPVTGPPEMPNATTVIRVENKTDLMRCRSQWVGVSAKTGAGMEEVRRQLEAWFRAGQQQAWIGLARHRDRAQEALTAVGEARRELARDQALELVAFQLGIAERRLGEITGRSALGPVGEDVLDRIFSRFCIGK